MIRRFNVVAALIFVAVCSYGENTVAIELSHHRSRSLDNPKTETLISSTPVKRATDSATLEYINSVCGQENINVDPQQHNIKETVTAWSRFPWTTVVLNKNNGKLKFQCGGSLISTRTVLSAAHCFMMNEKAEDFVVSMNWYNLRDWSDAFNYDVDKIILHSDYVFSDADLAVLQLKQSVTFTDSIKPICIWQGSKNLREIVGTSGTVVSWGGRKHNFKTNDVSTLKLVNATVVSQSTCLTANKVFSSLTGNRTFCAGNLDGTGPCIGDSGHGFMMKNKNKWMLRGILSTAPFDGSNNDDGCLYNDYVVYTDIAMFIEWINLNMLL